MAIHLRAPATADGQAMLEVMTGFLTGRSKTPLNMIPTSATLVGGAFYLTTPPRKRQNDISDVRWENFKVLPFFLTVFVYKFSKKSLTNSFL